MAKKKGSDQGKYRSATTGRYVSKHSKSSPKTTVREKGVSSEAREFSRQFNERYRDTLRDLSER